MPSCNTCRWYFSINGDEFCDVETIVIELQEGRNNDIFQVVLSLMALQSYKYSCVIYIDNITHTFF